MLLRTWPPHGHNNALHVSCLKCLKINFGYDLACQAIWTEPRNPGSEQRTTWAMYASLAWLVHNDPTPITKYSPPCASYIQVITISADLFMSYLPFKVVSYYITAYHGYRLYIWVSRVQRILAVHPGCLIIGEETVGRTVVGTPPVLAEREPCGAMGFFSVQLLHETHRGCPKQCPKEWWFVDSTLLLQHMQKMWSCLWRWVQ